MSIVSFALTPIGNKSHKNLPLCIYILYTFLNVTTFLILIFAHNLFNEVVNDFKILTSLILDMWDSHHFKSNLKC